MKVHNFTICDQVRQEINGKFILLGVYSNGIMLPQIPAQFNLGIWMLMESEELGTVQFRFRVRMPENGAELMSIDGEVEIVDLENWTPFGFGSQVIVGQAGSLVVEASFGDSDWVNLRTLHVKKGQIQLPVFST